MDLCPCCLRSPLCHASNPGYDGSVTCLVPEGLLELCDMNVLVEARGDHGQGQQQQWPTYGCMTTIQIRFRLLKFYRTPPSVNLNAGQSVLPILLFVDSDLSNAHSQSF